MTTDGNFSKDLLRGSLDLMILSVLSKSAQYGYLIQKELQIISRGEVELKAGTLYPLLHRLENRKWIRSRWDDSTGRRRKWYELTPQGERTLARYAQCIEQLIAPLVAPAKPSCQPKPG